MSHRLRRMEGRPVLSYQNSDNRQPPPPPPPPPPQAVVELATFSNVPDSTLEVMPNAGAVEAVAQIQVPDEQQLHVYRVFVTGTSTTDSKFTGPHPLLFVSKYDIYLQNEGTSPVTGMILEFLATRSGECMVPKVYRNYNLFTSLGSRIYSTEFIGSTLLSEIDIEASYYSLHQSKLKSCHGKECLGATNKTLQELGLPAHNPPDVSGQNWTGCKSCNVHWHEGGRESPGCFQCLKHVSPRSCNLM
ncbi:MAG: hypothetical protein M1840_003339 [Geoglossum simile]|nr:MAG: hypothetical protein M1840_003339 [Geoglossum simile]